MEKDHLAELVDERTRELKAELAARKRAEESLKESDQRHRAYLTNAPYGVFVTDDKGAFIQVNPFACRITGYQEHELLSMHVSDLYSEKSRKQAEQHFQTVIREGKSTGELMFRTKSGERRWWFVSAVKISDTRFLGFCNDTTASKRAEMDLQNREQTLQKIFDILPVGLWFADKNGKLLRGNPMGVKIWGAEPTVSISEYGVFKARRLPSGAEIAPDDWALAHTIREGVTISDELLEIDAFDGSKKIILNYSEPVRDSRGEIQGAIVVNQDITERKRSEDALRESETRFKALHNASFGGIAIHDKGRILECNQGLSEITGYSNDELIGMDGLLLISEKTRNMVMNNILSGYEKPYEAIGLRKNGEEYPIRLEARNIPYKGKNVRVVEFRDNTERKRAEEALRESEGKYRLIAENMSDVISVLDMNLKFTYVSPSIQRLTGYTVEESLKHSIEEIMTPESLQKILNFFEEEMLLEASGTADPARTRIIQFEQNKQDMSIGWVEAVCSFIRDMEQKPIGILVITRDITERKRAEAERERMMAAIEQAGEVIVITDPDGVIQYANPAFEGVSGYTQAEAMGQNPRILKSGRNDEIFYQQLWETISSGKTWSGRMINKKKDGSLYTEDATISPVFDAAGRIINYVAVKRDITEHLRLSDQLQQAQKMESVGRLAGGVAHDFNNMLSVISGYTELAMEKVDPDDPLHADLAEVYKAASRSTGIVKQLLAFARKQIVSPIIINLNDTVSGMIKMLRRLIGEDITLVWQPGADLWPVMLDPSQMDQLLANLCVNARDAIHDVGTVTIETKNTDIDADYCANHAYFVPGKYVLLTVSDTGCGMDPETVDKIFDPFYTTKEMGKGTGLGLSTVYGIVKQNNGFINVTSEPGQGTTFSIYLPRHADKAGQMPKEGPAEPDAHTSETILLVEDEPVILKMTAQMLERLGYTVLAANSPGEAIYLAREHKGKIHLLMTDVIMPEMNGRDLAKNILSLYPDINRLFMSGYTADIIARHGTLDAGVHFIQKPFSIKDLAAKLKTVMNPE